MYLTPKQQEKIRIHDTMAILADSSVIKLVNG